MAMLYLQACAVCAQKALAEVTQRVVVGIVPHAQWCGTEVATYEVLTAEATFVVVCDANDRVMVGENLAAVLDRHSGPRRIVLLAERRPAPEVMVSDDDRELRSYVVSVDAAALVDPAASCFDTLERLLGRDGVDVVVAQLPLDDVVAVPPGEPVSATWIIAHRGPLALLDGCLRAVVAAARPSDQIVVAFDEAITADHLELADRHTPVAFHRVDPPGTGPYIPRHDLASRATTPLIAWQDSDDVPTLDRMPELDKTRRARRAAMVGAQELRLDLTTGSLRIRRFALEPLRPLESGLTGAMVIGSAVVDTSTFRELGGYSTALRFGADLQFLFRASLSHSLANTNEVLSVRRVLPDSQTNHPATGFDSMERKKQVLTWRVQLSNVRSGALRLERSALMPTHLGDEASRLRPLQQTGLTTSSRVRRNTTDRRALMSVEKAKEFLVDTTEDDEAAQQIQQRYMAMLVDLSAEMGYDLTAEDIGIAIEEISGLGEVEDNEVEGFAGFQVDSLFFNASSFTIVQNPLGFGSTRFFRRRWGR